MHDDPEKRGFDPEDYRATARFKGPKTRRFPLLAQGETRWVQWIPWLIAEQAWQEYARCGHGDQSLERVTQRGGFSLCEIDALLAGNKLYNRPRDWRPKDPDHYNDWQRASGLCICDRCGLEYYEHPPCPWFVDKTTDTPWLTRLCDGRLVKL